MSVSRKYNRVLRVAFLALLILIAAPSVRGFAEKADIVPVNGVSVKGPPLYIPLGKAELVSVEGDVADVLIANPSIIDVTAIQSNRLYVAGLQVGDTNLIALDAKGDIVKQIDVHVNYDLTAIQALVNDLFPNEQVKVGSIHDQILLTGTVSNAQVATKVSSIVGHYVSDLQDEDGTTDELISNLLEVRGEQQVMLQVKIVEAKRSVLKELGIQTNANDPNELATQNIFGVTPFSSSTISGNNTAAGVLSQPGLALSNPAAAALRIFKDSGIEAIGTIGLFINALEEENLVNVLAEPNLTTVSGEQAGFLAGGETPVPSGLDQLGNIIVEFRQFGVSLNFRPTVMSDERISLQMNTEVSSINFDNAISAGAIRVPGFDVRRAETTVELPSGGSIMIAGILQSEAVKGMAGLPGVSKAPIIGDLLSSDSFQREETELVVIVTPYLIEPYAEKERADVVPVPRNNPLSSSFANNINQAYKVEDQTLFSGEGSFGYILN